MWAMAARVWKRFPIQIFEYIQDRFFVMRKRCVINAHGDFVSQTLMKVGVTTGTGERAFA